MAVRVWDLFLFEGESILLGMAYCILKLHSHSLLSMGMVECMEYLQRTLSTEFGYDTTTVMETALPQSLAELRQDQLHTAGKTTRAEKPRTLFGLVENIPEGHTDQALPVVASSDGSSDLFLTETASIEDELDASWKSDTTSETEMCPEGTSHLRDQVHFFLEKLIY